MVTSIEQPLALVRLLQLASPALPVGAYGYSQGLEWVVEERTVCDESGAKEWMQGVLVHSVARLDAPVLARMFDAWKSADFEALAHWNQTLIAGRGTHELCAEDNHLGQALVKLLAGLELAWPDSLALKKIAFALPFSFAACSWGISKTEALSGYLWAFLENQVLAAIKLVPLGQLAGQRILFETAGLIPDLVAGALQLEDDEIGAALPFMAVASSRHETQYSRLFRS